MLNGIPSILSPELLKVMMEMGHGDTIVIADGNFPGASMAQRLVRLDGHGAWSGKAERVIMCAVKPGQLGPLRRMVREIDPKSFLIVGDARTIYGHGFESIEED